MCKSAFYSFVFLAVIYITFLPHSTMAQKNNPLKAEIRQTEHDDQWTFTACFKNDSTSTLSNLSYSFEGLKKGNGGTSSTSQSGRFEAKPGRETELATIRYNAITRGKIELKLTILHDQTPIAGDTLEIKP